jgi:hypothetical protein
MSSFRAVYATFPVAYSICCVLLVIMYIIIQHLQILNADWLRAVLIDISHGKFISLYFFVQYYKRISTLVEIGKPRDSVKALRPPGVMFPHNFSFSQFPLVLIWLYITVYYQHGKCFISVKYRLEGKRSSLAVRPHRLQSQIHVSPLKLVVRQKKFYQLLATNLMLSWCCQ